jgi:HPt (histidine-containing phosphotransfer) domain-containing protein
MYVQEYLAKERQQERLRQAHQERSASQVAELRKLERRQERAERELLSTWKRVEQLRSAIGAVS